MSFSNFFAGLVALVGAGAIRWRHRGDKSIAPAYGSAPDIPAARPQGVPTLKMPTARGWTAQRRADCRPWPLRQRLREPGSSIRGRSTCCRTATC